MADKKKNKHRPNSGPNAQQASNRPVPTSKSQVQAATEITKTEKKTGLLSRSKSEDRRNLIMLIILILFLILALILAGLFIAAVANNQDNQDATSSSTATSSEESNSAVAESTEGSSTSSSLEATSTTAAEGSSETEGNDTSSESTTSSATTAATIDTTTTTQMTLPTSYSYSAEPGQGVSHLARKAIRDYLGATGRQLSTAQRLFMEVTLTNQHNPVYLALGESRTFAAATMDAVYNEAAALAPYQVSAWQEQVNASGYTGII
jgi:cytoskeletal protein RodZ